MTLLKFGSCYERIMQCETNQYVRTGLLKHLKTPPSSGGLEFSGKKKNWYSVNQSLEILQNISFNLNWCLMMWDFQG